MDYKEKAKGWYDRAILEKDEFVKFLLFYISLEVSTKLESSSIPNIAQNDSIKEKFYNKIDTKFLVELKRELDKKSHRNMQNPNDTRWSGELKSVNDFSGIIKFLMRARNNLFHGDKGLNEERDNFIVKSGNRILQPLVEAIFQYHQSLGLE